jgi:hypothetical protein
VFRMAPAIIVASTIRVRNVCDVHATPLRRRESHSASSAAAAIRASHISH